MALDDSMLSSFHQDLNRSAHLLRLIKEFREFAAMQVESEAPDGSVVWESARALHATAATVRTDLPVLAGSILLYICGSSQSRV